MDIQIDWLDFALQNFNLGEQDRKRFRREKKHAVLKSDEILLSGGGFTYDSSEKKFMNSKSELIYHNPTKKVNCNIESKTLISYDLSGKETNDLQKEEAHVRSCCYAPR